MFNNTGDIKNRYLLFELSTFVPIARKWNKHSLLKMFEVICMFVLVQEMIKIKLTGCCFIPVVHTVLTYRNAFSKSILCRKIEFPKLGSLFSWTSSYENNAFKVCRITEVRKSLQDVHLGAIAHESNLVPVL